MLISAGIHYCEKKQNNSGSFKMIGVPILCKVFLGVFFHLFFQIFHFSRCFLICFFLDFIFSKMFSFFRNNIDPKYIICLLWWSTIVSGAVV